QSYPLPSDTPPMNAAAPAREDKKDTESSLRGVTVLIGGGVEGYTGSLASRVNVGPAWDVIIGLHPTSVFGIEFVYSGAINSIKYGNFGLPAGNGIDILRNGGHADVTFAIGPWMVQPFVLAGVGANYYSVSSAAESAGFKSGWAGYIPLGGGVRAQIHGVTVDLRGTWSLPFSDNLYPGGSGQNTLGLSTGSYGRWNATLNVGGTF
ncbi:MAG TPA: hypothetical protein VLQ79_11530, partial [Myxococcaceae bacterium]|nr:hypothetical protein [Myxococcaceae bacterium]